VLRGFSKIMILEKLVLPIPAYNYLGVSKVVDALEIAKDVIRELNK